MEYKSILVGDMQLCLYIVAFYSVYWSTSDVFEYCRHKLVVEPFNQWYLVSTNVSNPFLKLFVSWRSSGNGQFCIRFLLIVPSDKISSLLRYTRTGIVVNQLSKKILWFFLTTTLLLVPRRICGLAAIAPEYKSKS